jgi:hypothetical protein
MKTLAYVFGAILLFALGGLTGTVGATAKTNPCESAFVLQQRVIEIDQRVISASGDGSLAVAANDQAAVDIASTKIRQATDEFRAMQPELTEAIDECKKEMQ